MRRAVINGLLAAAVAWSVGCGTQTKQTEARMALRAVGMGRLTWDTNKFPNPVQKLQHYKNDEGIGIIAIEESYIGKALDEHADLEKRGYLVRKSENGPPVYLTGNPWWGKVESWVPCQAWPLML